MTASFDALTTSFHFGVPAALNIGVVCSDVPADRYADRVAILEVAKDGAATRLSFRALAEASTRFSSSLAALGIKRGDRVAILLPQGAMVAIAHLAIYKLGAIAVPLAHVFQSGAAGFRLADSAAVALITDRAGAVKLSRILGEMALPHLKHLVLDDRSAKDQNSVAVFLTALSGAVDCYSYSELLVQGDPCFELADTLNDEPCLIIYTSGTTGQPKGALHGHRVLIGHLPGFELNHDPDPDNAGIFWTPADWAWAGGLLNVLFPALYFGQTVIAWPFEKFDPAAAYRLLVDHGVTNAFIPPTALRMLRASERSDPNLVLKLKTLASAGESLGSETYHWCESQLQLSVDEFYGQTECNYILGSCARLGVSRAGAIGKAIPGAHVEVLRADGTGVVPGEHGEIAIHRDHPSMFLGYWNQPQATVDKFRGEWMLTGDIAKRDVDGYISFIGRNDDVITSSGYRIGPVEIEDCLLRHVSVLLAAVIGKPDTLRSEIVKAFIVVKPGIEASDALKLDIQNFVRTSLSVHEYPREIAFVESLPMTSTGKIIRRTLRDEEILRVQA